MQTQGVQSPPRPPRPKSPTNACTQSAPKTKTQNISPETVPRTLNCLLAKEQVTAIIVLPWREKGSVMDTLIIFLGLLIVLKALSK